VSLQPVPGRNFTETAEHHYIEFLKSLGIWDKMEDEPRLRTPARVVEAYLEFFGNKLTPINFTTFPIPQGECPRFVAVCNITFASLCAHHHLPFTGVCHVGYLPGDRVAGLSKIPRVVEHLTHGAMIQEDVTEGVADYLEENLDPVGVIVVMDAEHTCMSLRGVRKPGHRARTMAMRGTLPHDYLQAFWNQVR